jgi:2-keto-3-deoxy-L-rhamnonate aldolase RhmA
MLKSIKHKLRQTNEVSLGTWLSLGNTHIAEIMCKAEFDWVTIDLEHTGISISQATELIRVIDLCGKSPLVRLSSNDSVQIKRVMDSGAHGIIVPMIKTVNDALSAYLSMQYPPLGDRGVGLFRAQDYGPGFKDYLEWIKENGVLIVQIEHIDAVKNLKNILALDEVDGFIIGPYDLSASMGIPGQFTNPDFIKILNEVKSIGIASKKAGGVHIVEPDLSALQDALNSNYRFIAYSVDFRMLDLACREATNFIKGKI